MKPGQTSLPRASISSSTVPAKARPTWTMRSFSHTTTPSRTRVWPWPAKPTTQPPRMSPRMAQSSRRGEASTGNATRTGTSLDDARDVATLTPALSLSEGAGVGPILSPPAGERVAVQAEALASSGEARAEIVRGHAGRSNGPHEQVGLAGDERARLGNFHALAVGGRGHREEPGVVRLGPVAV